MSGTTSGGNPAKATFYIIEGTNAGKTFTVQYNPKEFKEDKKVSWKEVDEQGKDKSPLEFQKGSPRSVTMDLIFDTTNLEQETSVYDKWIEPLMATTNADATPGSGESTKQSKKRPTTIRFQWGGYQLTGVIESISTSYTLFSASGVPLRAKVQVKMKEWDPTTFGFRTGAAGWAGTDIRLVQAVAGQTPTDLANQNGTTAQQICEDNDIEDPMQPFSGGEEVMIRPGYPGGASPQAPSPENLDVLDEFDII
jgi:hypothetical protein